MHFLELSIIPLPLKNQCYHNFYTYLGQIYLLLYRNGAYSKVKTDSLRELLEKKDPPFKIADGKVYRKAMLGHRDAHFKKEVPFVPFAGRADSVSKFHITLEHHSAKNKVMLMAPRFWWPVMLIDVTNWIASCPSCQINGQKASQEEMHSTPLLHSIRVVVPWLCRWVADRYNIWKPLLCIDCLKLRYQLADCLSCTGGKWRLWNQHTL